MDPWNVTTARTYAHKLARSCSGADRNSIYMLWTSCLMQRKPSNKSCLWSWIHLKGDFGIWALCADNSWRPGWSPVNSYGKFWGWERCFKGCRFVLKRYLGPGRRLTCGRTVRRNPCFCSVFTVASKSALKVYSWSRTVFLARFFASSSSPISYRLNFHRRTASTKLLRSLVTNSMPTYHTGRLGYMKILVPCRLGHMKILAL